MEGEEGGRKSDGEGGEDRRLKEEDERWKTKGREGGGGGRQKKNDIDPHGETFLLPHLALCDTVKYVGESQLGSEG